MRVAMPFTHFIRQRGHYDKNCSLYRNRLVFGIFFLCIIHNYKEELDEGKEVSHANESERQIF
jgi:hypothetical protein